MVNFVGIHTNSKQLLKTIKNYNVSRLLIINFSIKSDLNGYSQEKNDSEVLIVEPQEDIKAYLFKFLSSLKVEFEYLDISQDITNSNFVALLATKIGQIQTPATIDITDCPKRFVPFILQTTCYIPEFINELIMFSDDVQPVKISYPLIAFDFDPDKETHLLKEILSLFLTTQQNYADFSFNKTLSSTLILQLLNDEQVRNGNKEFKYPYIQACLSQLSQETHGKVNCLQRRHNSSDKRSLLYTITDHGVLTLLIWYLKQSEKELKDIILYNKLKTFFTDYSFSDIVDSHSSQIHSCVICEKQNVSELYTCSLCGQESCKDCLDNHFLNNKCQPQLQLA